MPSEAAKTRRANAPAWQSTVANVASIPIPAANLLWRDLHVRDSEKMEGKQRTKKNVRIDVVIEGVTNDAAWSCGLEFDYTNEESFVCRPMRKPGFEDTLVGKAEYSKYSERSEHRSGCISSSNVWISRPRVYQQTGEINFLIGQGQTAQVIRNLLFQIFNKENNSGWTKITAEISRLFGARLLIPKYIDERSEIILEYEENGTRLDLSCAGRGLDKIITAVAPLCDPATVLLLDEPDAHLEILRQRQIFELLTHTAEEQGSQIIAASHSEVVLNEAVGRGTVVSIFGKPHTINDTKSQVIKALNSIGWDQYYQAEEQGWVLYDRAQ